MTSFDSFPPFKSIDVIHYLDIYHADLRFETRDRYSRMIHVFLRLRKHVTSQDTETR